MAKEKLFTKEEVVELLRFAREEADATFDEAINAYAAGEQFRLDPSDTVESLLDIALMAGQALASAVNPLAAGLVATLGPSLTGVVVGAVEKAEESAGSPERLRKRIRRAQGRASRADGQADRLAATPQREAFEKVRIWASRRRARNQRERVEYLSGLLAVALAEDEGRL